MSLPFVATQSDSDGQATPVNSLLGATAATDQEPATVGDVDLAISPPLATATQSLVVAQEKAVHSPNSVLTTPQASSPPLGLVEATIWS